MTWITPLVAPLSTSMTLPWLALLLMLMKGLATCLVTVISSPAPDDVTVYRDTLVMSTLTCDHGVGTSIESGAEDET